MLNKPKLLLLDEPISASIDPSNARDTARAGVLAFVAAGQGAVLWTSHNMYEVAEVCHRVLFLASGRVVLEGDPKTLPAQHGAASLDDLFVQVAHQALLPEHALWTARASPPSCSGSSTSCAAAPSACCPSSPGSPSTSFCGASSPGYLERRLSRSGFNFVPALLGSGAAVGFPDASDAGRDHGLFRGRVVA